MYMCLGARVRAFVCMCACACANVHVCISAFLRACMHVWMRMCVCAYVRLCMRACVRACVRTAYACVSFRGILVPILPARLAARGGVDGSLPADLSSYPGSFARPDYRVDDSVSAQLTASAVERPGRNSTKARMKYTQALGRFQRAH